MLGETYPNVDLPEYEIIQNDLAILSYLQPQQ
jgi:hypothetical protein